MTNKRQQQIENLIKVFAFLIVVIISIVNIYKINKINLRMDSIEKNIKECKQN